MATRSPSQPALVATGQVEPPGPAGCSAHAVLVLVIADWTGLARAERLPPYCFAGSSYSIGVPPRGEVVASMAS